MSGTTGNFTVCILFGWYEMREVGLLSFKRVWHHNETLSMSRSEQLRLNKANHNDFCEEKYLPPAVSIVDI